MSSLVDLARLLSGEITRDLDTRLQRLEEQMATFSDDVTALLTAITDNASAVADLTQATKDTSARVDADFAALKAQIAAGTAPDPALVASIEGGITSLTANTAAAHSAVTAIAAIDPAAPAAPSAPPAPAPAPA